MKTYLIKKPKLKKNYSKIFKFFDQATLFSDESLSSCSTRALFQVRSVYFVSSFLIIGHKILFAQQRLLQRRKAEESLMKVKF